MLPLDWQRLITHDPVPAITGRVITLTMQGVCSCSLHTRDGLPP